MTAELDERLAAAAAALLDVELARARREELRGRRQELTGQLAELQARAADEQHDVDRLEGRSLTRVLAALHGAREDRLARERAEAEAARYRVAEAEALLAAVDREEQEVAERLAGLGGAPARYAELLAEKERRLAASGGPRAARLLDLAAERGRLTAERREIAEARQAATAAAQALVPVQDALGSASGWSTYDTFLGGRGISSAIKHSRLDEAAAAATAADQKLAVLRTELADVASLRPVAPRLPVTGLTRFADVWFDNFFTDLAVDARIRHVRQNVARCAQLVVQVQSQLAARDAAVATRLGEIEGERRSLLTRPSP